MTRSWQLFPLALVIASLFATGCFWTMLASPGPASMTGVLDVDVNYTGTWYRDTFDYTRDGKNIRHFVLILPADVAEARNADADWIFSSLAPQPEGVSVRPDRREYAWALGYVHEAPGGYLSVHLPPGTYQAAAAFIAGPLTREEAGAGDDAILWAGVTGGGASTDFREVKIEAGETASVTFTLTDANGWACPWLYLYDGETFVRWTEILRSMRGPARETTEVTALGPVTVVDGAVVLRIAEEKAEITYLDGLWLSAGGEEIRAEGAPDASALAAVDGVYLVLEEGDVRELTFRLPDAYRDGDTLSVVATGYYEPLASEG